MQASLKKMLKLVYFCTEFSIVAILLLLCSLKSRRKKGKEETASHPWEWGKSITTKGHGHYFCFLKENFIAFPVQARVLHVCVDEKTLPSGCRSTAIHPGGTCDAEMVWFYPNLEDVKCKKERSQHRKTIQCSLFLFSPDSLLRAGHWGRFLSISVCSHLRNLHL